MNRNLACLVALTLGAMVAVTDAGPTPVADGRFDPDEGYSIGHYLHLEVEKDKDNTVPADDPGELWLHQDAATNDVYFALILPLSLVDNTYGANIATDWSPQTHTFKNLKDSDVADFQFVVHAGPDETYSFEIDYLADSAETESGYDAKAGGADAASLLAVGTSLDYNFNDRHHVLTTDSPAMSSDYVPVDSDYNDWVFEIIYEGQIDGTLFETGGFGGLTIPVIHVSPNKIAKNRVFPTVDGVIPTGSGVIPEPISVAFMGSAFVGVVVCRMRKRRKTTKG